MVVQHATVTGEQQVARNRTQGAAAVIKVPPDLDAHA